MHVGIQKVCQRGSNSHNVFFPLFVFDEWRKDSDTTISRPPSAHLNVVSQAGE